MIVSAILMCLFASPVESKAGDSAAQDMIETIAGTGKPELGAMEGKALEVNINQPFGLELGPDGALYICEVGHHRVLRLDLAAKTIRTVAGTGKMGLAGEGVPATQADLNEPYEVRFDPAGDMFFVEMQNALVRRVERISGRIFTVAGTGEAGFSGDGGPAVKARLKQPHSIAFDEVGRLYIADIGNHRIRRVDLKSGTIDSIAGDGSAKPFADGPAVGMPLPGPRALATRKGSLWIALREGHSLLELDLTSGRVKRIAGAGQPGWRDGPAAQALFNGPKGLALDSSGAAYLMDTENHAVRRVDPVAGVVTTLAGGEVKGTGASGDGGGFAGDGGPASGARLNRPHGIAVSPSGDTIYVGDSNNHRVRRIKRAAR